MSKLRWGAGYRFDRLNEALAGFFKVQTLYVSDMPFSKHSNTRLPRSGYQSIFNPIPAWAQHVSSIDQQEFEDHLRSSIAEFSPDLVIFSGTSILPYLNRKLDLPTVIDAYDLRWVIVQRTLLADKPVPIRRRLRTMVEVTLAKRYEGRKHNLADEIWVCSNLEKTKVVSNSYRGRVRVVPNFFSKPCSAGMNSREYTARKRPIILFVGTMGYTPNRDGVSWFLKNVWPIVHNAIPDAEFWIAGQWPEWTTPTAEYCSDGVKLLGFVDDLESIWSEASVFVCPIRIGSGTRIKILEAWSHGLPVVATITGIDGLEAKRDVHAYIEDDSSRFADSVIRLANDSIYAGTIGVAGFNFWKQNYTEEKALGKAIASCKEILEVGDNALDLLV